MEGKICFTVMHYFLGKVFQLLSLLAVLGPEELSISAPRQPEYIPFPGKPMASIKKRSASLATSPFFGRERLAHVLYPNL